MKCRYFLISLGLSVASLPATAGLINYELDVETGHIVNTEQGLEYLHFSNTNGLTVQQAFDQFGGDGWSVASDEQGARLVVDAMNLYEYHYNEIVNNEYFRSGYATDYHTDPLGDLFGYTFYRASGYTDVNGWAITQDSDQEGISIKYGDIDDGYINIFGVSGSYKQYSINDPDTVYNRTGSMYMNFNSIQPHNREYGAVLMVRNVQVSEPGSLALLGLGLAGLGFARRKSNA